MDETRFLWMNRQAISSESFRKHLHHATRVVLTSESNDKVIRIADEECSSPQTRLNLIGEPPVQNVMQVDVGQ